MAVATLPKPNRLTIDPTRANSSAARSIFIDEMKRAFPQNVNLVDPSQTILKQSIQLTITRIEDGGWLAQTPRINTYGYGETVSEAAKDFFSMLNDLYCELKTTEDVLAPHLKHDLDYLRTLLVDVEA